MECEGPAFADLQLPFYEPYERGFFRDAILQVNLASSLISIDLDDKFCFNRWCRDAAANDTMVGSDLRQGKAMTSSQQPATDRR